MIPAAPTRTPLVARDDRASWFALRGPAGVALVAAAGAVALQVRDPAVPGSWGPAGIGLCPLHAVTGLWCPGCGGLRAMANLLDLDVVAALGNNAPGVLLVVVLAVAWVRWVADRWRGRPAPRMIVLSPTASTAVLWSLALFTLVRNTPWGAGLAP